MKIIAMALLGLAAAAPAAPDMHSAPVQNTDHYRINVVQRTKPQGGTRISRER